MNYPEYVERWHRHSSVARVSEYGVVNENGRDYPLLRAHIDLPESPKAPRALVTAGFHGEEPAGPLTLLDHLPDIAAYARKLGVALSIYPCVNPSGFEAGTRYNASGEKPNNDFLRYEVRPGVWVDDLEPGDTFLQVTQFDGGPKEIRPLRTALHAEPAPRAALDIHQDDYLGKPLAYAYFLGPRSPMVELAARTEPVLTVARDFQVDVTHRTDADGLIERNDGSVTDYFFRRGVRFNATLETTTHTPMNVCHAVNLLWIRGFIELALSPD